MVDIVFDGEYKPKEYQKNMFFAMALNNDGLNVDREDLQENWSKKSLNLKLKMLKTFNKFLSENAPDAIGEEQSELKDFLFQDITDMF